MIETPISCPLCLSAAIRPFYQDQHRDYLRCSGCQLVFVPKQFHLNAADEQAQYDHHENDPSDSGYRKFLGRLADPLLQRLTANSQGLDFGCGPGPCLSVMLEEQGHSMDLFDLYYANNSSVFERQYDFITATEVVEHLSQPMVELQRLWDLLKPGGYLGLMTKLVGDADKFANWHYKTDPTHISFFSEQSFAYLGQQWGSAPVFIGADVIMFQKPQ
jgi:SAM-dependent methyltransferase